MKDSLSKTDLKRISLCVAKERRMPGRIGKKFFDRLDEHMVGDLSSRKDLDALCKEIRRELQEYGETSDEVQVYMDISAQVRLRILDEMGWVEEAMGVRYPGDSSKSYVDVLRIFMSERAESGAKPFTSHDLKRWSSGGYSGEKIVKKINHIFGECTAAAIRLILGVDELSPNYIEKPKLNLFLVQRVLQEFLDARKDSGRWVPSDLLSFVSKEGTNGRSVGTWIIRNYGALSTETIALVYEKDHKVLNEGNDKAFSLEMVKKALVNFINGYDGDEWCYSDLKSWKDPETNVTGAAILKRIRTPESNYISGEMVADFLGDEADLLDSKRFSPKSIPRLRTKRDVRSWLNKFFSAHVGREWRVSDLRSAKIDGVSGEAVRVWMQKHLSVGQTGWEQAFEDLQVSRGFNATHFVMH